MFRPEDMEAVRAAFRAMACDRRTPAEKWAARQPTKAEVDARPKPPPPAPVTLHYGEVRCDVADALPVWSWTPAPAPAPNGFAESPAAAPPVPAVEEIWQLRDGVTCYGRLPARATGVVERLSAPGAHQRATMVCVYFGKATGRAWVMASDLEPVFFAGDVRL